MSIGPRIVTRGGFNDSKAVEVVDTRRYIPEWRNRPLLARVMGREVVERSA